MTFVQGQSGNPKGNGGWSTRRKDTRDALSAIKNAGYIDPLVALAKIAHESDNEGIRCSANSTLCNYLHPKQQSVPALRYIDRPFKVPVFQTIKDAKDFLATIPNRIAAQELDLDFADSLTKSTVAWLQLQYAEMGIDLKAQAQGTSDRDQVIRIEGGLPALPGTNVTMPPLNGNKSYELVEHHSPGNGPSPATAVAAAPTQAAEPQDPPP